MKIDNTTLITTAQQTSKSNGSSKAQSTGASSASPTPGTVTHLSERANDSSYDINSVRVAELQQAIKSGQLEINAEKIADSLIASVRDLLAVNSQ